jgi:hypothetical protein
VYSKVVPSHHSLLFAAQKEGRVVYISRKRIRQPKSIPGINVAIDACSLANVYTEKAKKSTFLFPRPQKRVVSQARKKIKIIQNADLMPARSKRRHKACQKRGVCIAQPPALFVFQLALCSSKRRLLLPPLLREDFPGDGEHSLEALAALGCVLAEPVNGDFLDAVLDLLPAAAHGDDFGCLVEDCHAGPVGCGCVADGLLHG